MKRVWLVQRLQEPIDTGVANPFTFGGGLANGGISPVAMGLLSAMFSFDYMGAAEFEFGAVPRAFQALASLSISDELTTSVMDIDGSNVYMIAPKTIIDELNEWILEKSSTDYNNDLKESLGLKRSLGGFSNIKGWIKIEKDRRCDEPFMFFTDETMFNNMSNFLGLINKETKI